MPKYIILFCKPIGGFHSVMDAIPYSTIRLMCKKQNIPEDELRNEIRNKKGDKFPLLFEGCLISKLEIIRK